MTWSSIEVTVDPEAADAIEHLLNELDALGTEINHLQKKSFDATTVIGYFTDPPDEETFQDELQYTLRAFELSGESVRNIERRSIENSDWLAEWKKHWTPSEVGRFIVAPPWSDVEQTERLVIRIEPNMAFGTGTHETTQLCLRSIQGYYEPGQSFLDVGTGTGILSIAAAMSGDGSEPILACDTDVDSVKIAKENAELNKVEDRIDLYVGSIEQNTPVFDFVAANLTIDVITPMLSMLVGKARRTLLLSGILVEQKQEIMNELAKLNITDADIESAGEWISVVVTPNRP